MAARDETCTVWGLSRARRFRASSTCRLWPDVTSSTSTSDARLQANLRLTWERESGPEACVLCGVNYLLRYDFEEMLRAVEQQEFKCILTRQCDGNRVKSQAAGGKGRLKQ